MSFVILFHLPFVTLSFKKWGISRGAQLWSSLSQRDSKAVMLENMKDEVEREGETHFV